MTYNEKEETVEGLSSIDYFNEIVKAGVPGPLDFSSKFSKFSKVRHKEGPIEPSLRRFHILY